MTNADRELSSEPLRVSILTQGSYLIASIHTALDLEEGLAYLGSVTGASIPR